VKVHGHRKDKSLVFSNCWYGWP